MRGCSGTPPARDAVTLDRLEKVLVRIGAYGTTPAEAATGLATVSHQFSALQPNFEVRVGAVVWSVQVQPRVPGSDDEDAGVQISAVPVQGPAPVLPYTALTHLPSVLGGVLLFRSADGMVVVRARDVLLVPTR
jgi:hypothetical protein